MQPHDYIKDYSNKVIEQIRWKKAGTIIASEIENHLYDQRDAYILNGEDEYSATQKSIQQMGDAVFIGQELDKAYRPRPQWFMMLLTGFLLLIGMIAQYAIASLQNSSSTFHIFPYILAFGLFFICYHLDFTLLGKHAIKLYFFLLITSILGVILSTRVAGALTLCIGRFSMSLSYLSILFSFAYALFLYRMRKQGLKGVLLCGLAYLPFACILLAIPSLTGFFLYTIVALVLVCFCAAQGWFEIHKTKLFSLSIFCSILVFFTVGILFLHHSQALFLNSQQAPYGSGYFGPTIQDILVTSHILGKGSTSQSIELLPNLRTDYTLVYLIHEFGLITLLCIAVITVAFCSFGVYKGLQQKSVLGSLITIAVVTTFALQVILYCTATLSCGAFAPLALPFISYGNTSLFLNASLIGCMLSVFRTGEIVSECPLKITNTDNPTIFTYENRNLIINVSRKPH